jgi:hypothetical protein
MIRKKDIPGYSSWLAMKQRCLNKNFPKYKSYGARGITVSEDWLKFDNFIKDMGQRPPNHTLDRINNDGDYCKENCRWATPKEQSNNRSGLVKLTYKGQEYLISEAAEKFGISRDILYLRLYKGWPTELAIELPKLQKRDFRSLKGTFISEWKLFNAKLD